jgi:hypothetical protein
LLLVCAAMHTISVVHANEIQRVVGGGSSACRVRDRSQTPDQTAGASRPRGA